MLSSVQGQDQVKIMSQKITTLKTHIRDVAHLLWAILHVEYDGDGILSIRAHLCESRIQIQGQIKVKSKRPNLDIFNLEK